MAPCGDLGPLIQAVAITEALSALPAVPTPDWCDRVAECLTLVGPPCAAVAIACVCDETGRVRLTEAAGAAVRRDDTRARAAGRALPRCDTPTACQITDRLRSACQRLTSIGWTLGTPTSPVGCMLAELPGGRAWRNGPVGRLWSGVSASEVFAALVPLPGAPGRALLLYAAPLAGAALSEGDAGVLRAALPSLARRARHALAAEPDQAVGRWLTAREHEVLGRIILGQSVREIAESLGRSPHTVHDYVKSLHRKLGAASRGELVAKAISHTAAAPAPLPASMIEPGPLPAPAPSAGAA